MILSFQFTVYKVRHHLKELSNFLKNHSIRHQQSIETKSQPYYNNLSMPLCYLRYVLLLLEHRNKPKTLQTKNLHNATATTLI
jgi:hypothetical protein